MAAVIMLASLLYSFLLGGSVLVSSQPSDAHDDEGPVSSSPVVSAIGAHEGFLRSKRANRYLLEEILQGDLERECYEERCTYEEAREYFEDTTQTITFWTLYVDGDQCEPNPCLHGGNCTDKVGGFSCTCLEPQYGPICELGAPEDLQGRRPSSAEMTVPEMTECPTDGPTACHQLCRASYRSFTCSCMSGFKLQSDGRSCLPEVKFPCGRLSDTSVCRHGNCPWQVSLLNSRGAELCSGVVLGRHSVLTAAHCLVQESGSDLRPSNFYVVPGNRKMAFPVQAVYLHDRFHPGNRDNDLALLELASPLPFGPALIHLCLPTKDFSENILMHPGRTGVTKHLDLDSDLVYTTLDECRKNMNVSYRLSNKMFCMMSPNELLEHQNGAARTPDKDSNHRNGDSGNQNRVPGRTQGGLENTNVALGSPRQSDSSRSHHGNQRGRTRPLRNGNEPQSPRGSSLSSQEARNQTGVGERVQGHVVTPIQTSNERTNGSWNPGSSRLRGGRQLPGSPVATVEQGTVFLTGLLISTHRHGDNGVVFTKLSRYLNWIRPRLEASENAMTPQVNLYPDRR